MAKGENRMGNIRTKETTRSSILSNSNKNSDHILMEGISKRRNAIAAGTLIVLTGIGALSYGKCSATPTEQTKSTGDKGSEVKKYSYHIDGFEIETSSVPEPKFKEAYQKAKTITGGIYWKPRKLSVEYGDVSSDFNTETMKHQESRASWTSPELDKIIANPDHLPHELVHFLLGPEAYKWPPVLQEFIAGAADELKAQYKYDDLNQEWVQMPIDQSMYSGSPLTSPRYAALHAAGRHYKQKMPVVIKAALQRHDLTFDNVSVFLKQFNIEHKIFERGKSGGYQTCVPYTDSDKSGYVFIRYGREAGKGDEFGWIGQIWATFFDDADQRYEMQNSMKMEGVIFIPAPQKTGMARKITKVKIIDNEGHIYERNFD